jgi:hypothetical protein
MPFSLASFLIDTQSTECFVRKASHAATKVRVSSMARTTERNERIALRISSLFRPSVHPSLVSFTALLQSTMISVRFPANQTKPNTIIGTLRCPLFQPPPPPPPPPAEPMAVDDTAVASSSDYDSSPCAAAADLRLPPPSPSPLQLTANAVMIDDGRAAPCRRGVRSRALMLYGADQIPDAAYEVVKKVKRTHTIPNVGATVRETARAMGRDEDLCSDLYPAVVRRLMDGRTSIFTVLDAQLQQRFNLDNGMALQRILEWWIKGYRPPRMPFAHDPLRDLKRHREPLAVHWGARTCGFPAAPGFRGKTIRPHVRGVKAGTCASGRGRTNCGTTWSKCATAS